MHGEAAAHRDPGVATEPSRLVRVIQNGREVLGEMQGLRRRLEALSDSVGPRPRNDRDVGEERSDRASGRLSALAELFAELRAERIAISEEVDYLESEVG